MSQLGTAGRHLHPRFPSNTARPAVQTHVGCAPQPEGRVPAHLGESSQAPGKWWPLVPVAETAHLSLSPAKGLLERQHQFGRQACLALAAMQACGHICKLT